MKLFPFIFALVIGCYGMNKSSSLQQRIHDHLLDVTRYRKGGRISIQHIVDRVPTNKAQTVSQQNALQTATKTNEINHKIAQKHQEMTVEQHPDHPQKATLEQSIATLDAQKMDKEMQIKHTTKQLAQATQTLSGLKRMERDLDKLQSIASVHNKHSLPNALFNLVDKYVGLKYDSRMGKGSHRVITVQDHDGNTLKKSMAKSTKGRDMKQWLGEMMDMMQEATSLDIDVYDMQETVHDAKKDAHAAEVELSLCAKEARLIKEEIEKMQQQIGEIEKYEREIHKFQAELSALETEKVQLEQKTFEHIANLYVNQHDGLLVNYVLIKQEPKRQQLQKKLGVLRRLNDTKYDEQIADVKKELSEMTKLIITNHNINSQTEQDVEWLLYSLQYNYQFIGRNHVIISLQCMSMMEKRMAFMMSLSFEEYQKFFCLYKTVFDFGAGLFQTQISRATNMTLGQPASVIAESWVQILNGLMHTAMLHVLDMEINVENAERFAALTKLLGTRDQMKTFVVSSEVKRKMKWSHKKLLSESRIARKSIELRQDQKISLLAAVQFFEENAAILQILINSELMERYCK